MRDHAGGHGPHARLTQGSRSGTHAGVTLLTFLMRQGCPPYGGTPARSVGRVR